LNKRNKFSAAALATALLLAPFTPALSFSASARPAYQQDDIPSDAEQAMFTKGQALYNQGRYDPAATVLQDFLKTYPHSIITDLTLLWLGRSYMQLGKIKEAEQVGQRLHAIKDTPFADIYDGELESARAEAGTRTTLASSTTAAKVPETNKTVKPVARKVNEPPPTATPSPTPGLANKNNSSTNQPPGNSTPGMTASNKTPATQSLKPPVQTQLNNSSSTSTTQMANNAVSPSRRGTRQNRRE